MVTECENPVQHNAPPGIDKVGAEAEGPAIISSHSSPEKPRRNLTQAFEALYPSNSKTDEGVQDAGRQLELEVLSPTAVSGPGSTEKKGTVISPTGVADIGNDVDFELSVDGDVVNQVPKLKLHSDLALDLSLQCIQRVSFYSIIHDINKECTAMAQHDPLVSLATEKDSPLVMAANPLSSKSTPAQQTPNPSKAKEAVIDEEQWLLSAIAERTPQETRSSFNADCPSTFLQAMGEKEYENPIQSVTGHSRTQLWKPSRSWWEAKSGKNPWIEPASHNKRWRYLWPLIHYHKFLAKCIKKLKRNGVDVKLAISPVSVFLREEVCAVSDHLAAVSLFDSDEWMACLQHFTGWTVVTPQAEKHYRSFVSRLPLRPITEPGDIDSPVLRNQIDQNFLRTMAAQREQMRDPVVTTNTNSAQNSLSTNKKSNTRSTQGAAPGVSSTNVGQPPMYPRISPQQASVPRQVHGVRRPRYYPQHNNWYGWEGQHFQDTSSVHSELSANSYPQQNHQPFEYHGPPPGMFPMPGNGEMAGFYPNMAAYPGSAEHPHSAGGYPYNSAGYGGHSGGWMHPNMAAYGMDHLQQQMDGYYSQVIPVSPAGIPPSPVVYPLHQPETSEVVGDTNQLDSTCTDANDAASSQAIATPFKYDPDCSITQSPYWSHLDQATLSMGLATPAKPPSPMTPLRRGDDKRDDQENDPTDHSEGSGFALTATAPLLRQHYYSYGNYTMGGALNSGKHEGYVPPSPATQFMMSPHSHPNSSFAYNFGYGFSPRRPSHAMVTPRSGSHLTTTEKTALASPQVDSNRSLTPLKLSNLTERQSPSTVETTTDTESLPEHQVSS